MEEQKQAEQQWNKIRRERINILKEAPSEENLWQAVMAFQDYPFKTVTGLPFQYTLKTGKNGEWTKELWIDRREKSKSLSWSSVVLAFKNSRKTTEIVKRPKALGDIRGISYIYPILWRLGLIRVPEKFEEKMACDDEKNDLGLAYSFGDGKVTSCQYMVDAVSNLFYGMPINGYVALNMNAVAMINDAVGGVTVTVPEDMTQVDPSFAEGAAVTLTGDQALKFTRYRDTEKDFSNNSRMERQKQYLVNFMGQAVKAMKADMGLPVSLYQSLTDDMVTNLSLDRSVYLATEAMDMHFTADGIVSLKAKSKKGSVYDEVYVDDDALYDLIIQTFYTEEQSEGESK